MRDITVPEIADAIQDLLMKILNICNPRPCVICLEETEILEYNYLRSESLADNPPFWFLMAYRRHSMRMVKTSPVPQILESSLQA